jgi:hypothetical protein
MLLRGHHHVEHVPTEQGVSSSALGLGKALSLDVCALQPVFEFPLELLSCLGRSLLSLPLLFLVTCPALGLLFGAQDLPVVVTWTCFPCHTKRLSAEFAQRLEFNIGQPKRLRKELLLREGGVWDV